MCNAHLLAQVLVLLFYFLLLNIMHLLPVDHSIASGQCDGIVYIDT